MKKLAMSVVGMALALTAVTASAENFPLGEIPMTGNFEIVGIGNFVENTSGDPAGTAFTDTYTFTIPLDNTTTDISIIRVPLTQSGEEILLFENFRTRLYNGGDVIALDNDGQTGDLQLMANTLYTIEVTGRAVGIGGGLYSGAVVVSAVPIPAAGLLFFSGIAALGLVRSKRASA